MPDRGIAGLALAASISLFVMGKCLAQFPEGGPVPLSTVNKDELHTEFRFGYNANGNIYAYPGEYKADGNFFANGRQSFYGIGDVLVESRLEPNDIFGPQRLWGTFEAGGRTILSRGNYLDLFIRHQSAHNVDNTAGPDSMWEYEGLRYRHSAENYDVWVSGGYYSRRIYLNYSTDFEVHASYRHGSLFGRPVSLDGDIHYVAENAGPRSGFVDCDVEPSLRLNKSMSVYVDYGLLHDENVPNGKTDVPLIFGAKADLP